MKLPRLFLVSFVGLFVTLGFSLWPGGLAMATTPGEIRAEIDERGLLHLTPDGDSQGVAFSLQHDQTSGEMIITSRSGRVSFHQPIRADQNRFMLKTGQGHLALVLPQAGERLDLELAYDGREGRAVLKAGPNLEVVGADLAGSLSLLAENRLTLGPGSFNVAGDLSLLAGQTLRIRDKEAHPLLAHVKGHLTLQGQQALDIFALSHPASVLISGGDMVLRSEEPVRGDAHYLAGGRFRIERLDGRAGHLVSPYDPIILASQNVSLGSYTGASLHILAGGSVTLNSVTITGNDTAANTINPGNAALFNGADAIGSLASFNLSDGTPVTINGNTQPTLDVRAGVNWGTFAGGAPANQVIPPAALVPTFSGPVANAGITVGNITISPPNGLVLLTNQYRPSGSSGDITTGNINTSTASPGGNGGAILIDSRDNITAGSLNTTANVAGSAASNGGAVRVIAEGNINQGNVSTFAQSGATTAGNGGSVTITAGGTLSNMSISSYVQSVTGSGNAGDINITAAGPLTLTALRSHARFSGTGFSGHAGDVNILVRNTGLLDGGDDLHLDQVWSDSGAWYYGGAVGSSGNGANVSLVSEDGDVIFDNWIWVQTLARGGTHNSGNGGNIAITATNGGFSVRDFGINTRSQVASGGSGNAGKGGDVTIIATGTITNPTFGGIDTRSVALTGNSLGGGAILLQSTGSNINFGPNDLNSLSDTSSGQAGNGGSITLEAAGGIIAGDLRSLAESDSGNAGNAGPVELVAGNDIEVASINATALGGASHGAGGKIMVETNQFFRVTGSTPFTASIASQGLANSSSIIINHGGAGITPFIVGDATTNGTAGAITTGDALLDPTQSFLNNHFEAPNIWIISVSYEVYVPILLK